MSKDWKELSVLIVGCGSIGKRHARVLVDLGLGDIRACDSTPQARQQMAEQTPSVSLFDSYEDGLKSNPEAVFICVPTELHVPMAMGAVRSGCHVFIEKPLSDTTESVDELSAMARGNNRKVMVGLCSRYHEGVLKMYSALGSGCVGRLVCVRALVGEHLPDARPDYRDLQCAKHGGVFELMHDLDLAIWMTNSAVKRVHAVHGNYGGIGIEASDLAEFLIEFEGPYVATVHLDFFQRPRRRQLELICTEGVIALEFSQWDQCTLSTYDLEQQEWLREDIPTERDQMFRVEDLEFLKAVACDLPISCTIEEGLKSVQVIQHANKGD